MRAAYFEGRPVVVLRKWRRPLLLTTKLDYYLCADKQRYFIASRDELRLDKDLDKSFRRNLRRRVSESETERSLLSSVLNTLDDIRESPYEGELALRLRHLPTDSLANPSHDSISKTLRDLT